MNHRNLNRKSKGRAVLYYSGSLDSPITAVAYPALILSILFFYLA